MIGPVPSTEHALLTLCRAFALDLLLRDVLSMCATSRSMHNVMRKMTTLRIDHVLQMNAVVALRFRGVTKLHVNLLMHLRTYLGGTFDEISEVELDLETTLRTVPFLSQLPSLRQLAFGVKTDAGEDIPRFAPASEYFSEGSGEQYPSHRTRMQNFLDSLSAAYACGALSQQLKISGLCCPDSSVVYNCRNDTDDCETCRRACNSFPLDSVRNFESSGSSVHNAASKRSLHLDVCLKKATIRSIVEGRRLHRSRFDGSPFDNVLQS